MSLPPKSELPNFPDASKVSKELGIPVLTITRSWIIAQRRYSLYVDGELQFEDELLDPLLKKDPSLVEDLPYLDYLMCLELGKNHTEVFVLCPPDFTDYCIGRGGFSARFVPSKITPPQRKPI